MRASAPLPSRARARTTTAAVFAAVVALALAPAAAADEHDEAEETEESVVIDAEPAPGAGQDLRDAQVRTQPVVDTCTDVLLVVSPDGAAGNEAAVAITAQAIDRDVDGWINVSWAAAAGTELTAVTIHRVEGTVTLVDDLATGSAQDVLELTFCGTSTAVAPAVPEPAPQPAPDTPASGGGTSGATGGNSSGTTSGGTSPSPAPSRAAPDPSDAKDTTDAPDPTDAGDAPTTTMHDAAGEAEVADDAEVLGVRLTREDGGSSGLDAGVFALVLAGVAAAGVGGFLLARRFGLLGLGVVR